jgi:hypothetical protein
LYTKTNADKRRRKNSRCCKGAKRRPVQIYAQDIDKLNCKKPGGFMLSDVVNDILDESKKCDQDKLANRDFKGGFTGLSVVLMLLSLAVSAFLLFYGIENNKLFPAGIDSSARILFVYAPLVFAGISVIFTLYTVISNLITSVEIRQSGVRFVQGAKVFEVTWQGLVFTVPRRGKIRTLLISDGYFAGRVNSMFLPNFNQLVETLDYGKARCNKKSY